MQRVSRMIGLGYLGICLIALAWVMVIGPLGYAPFALRVGPAASPVVVTIWYGTEKKAWLEEAKARFEATAPQLNGRPIQIQLVGLGSREIAERTAQQQWGSDPPPTVISPASSVWVTVLQDTWSQRGNSGPIVAGGSDAPRPLVLTPLVLAIWDQRAQLLWGSSSNFWGDLHDALIDPAGWKGRVKPTTPADLGSRAESWGFVKFGHTSPLTSNSGAQTLILLAYGYYNKTSGLTAADISNPGFQKWFLEVERSVPEFGDSTGTFMTNLVRYGPSKFDAVLVYESTAIESITAAQGRWGDTLRLAYPPGTMFSDHPYVVLDGTWTTREQRAAAAEFRTFLLSRPMQELALKFGFRPADASVPITTSDPQNPFNTFAQYGVKVDVPQQVETPPGEVTAALLSLWQREVNR